MGHQQFGGIETPRKSLKMKLKKNADLLKLFLIFMAVHSFIVGIALILLPAPYLEFFGLKGYHYTFFQAQGGVFHVVMALAYILAVKYITPYGEKFSGARESGLIVLAVSAKSMAAVFLTVYFMLSEKAWVIILSAFGDAFMAFVLFILYRKYMNCGRSDEGAQ